MHELARTVPRVLDVVLAGVALLLLSPLLLAVAAAIPLFDGRPVMFRQVRVGRRGEPFRIHKLRTLAAGSDDEGEVAPEGDPRITGIGRWLRHYRVDELPQLFDVLRGRMSLVGPRPETPANLEHVLRDQLERWLAVLPGLTGATQLAFIAEDELLAEAENPTELYRKVLVPAKVRHGIAWLEQRSPAGDLWLLAKTPFVLASRRAQRASRERVRALLAGAAFDAGTSACSTPGSQPRRE